MIVTIDTDNPKSKAFVEFIKTLEFVQIEDYALTDEQLSIVNDTRASYLKGEKTFSLEEVKAYARKKQCSVELEFSKNAREEISTAYLWYENQQANLGERFLEHLESKASFIQKHPKAYPLRHHYLRLALLDKFPFLLVYELLKEKVIVYHVFHTSRNPEYWKR